MADKLAISGLLDAIVKAITPILKKGGQDAVKMAKQEAEEFAETLAKIAKAVADGTMTEDTASDLLEAQKTVTQMTLLTAEGMTLKIAQDAINAGLKAVADVVNAALPFKLL